MPNSLESEYLAFCIEEGIDPESKIARLFFDQGNRAAAPVSPPAQKPGSELGGSLPGLVGTPIKPRDLVRLKDGRTLKVQRVSKRGVLTLVHTCGGFACFSYTSAVVLVAGDAASRLQARGYDLESLDRDNPYSMGA